MVSKPGPRPPQSVHQLRIKVEAISLSEPGVRYPVCSAGRRACPPEDCGGPFGYQELIEILANPKHRDYREMLEWLGGPLEPDKFDIDAINKQLARVKEP